MNVPDDSRFRREMASAYRSGWHFIDLVTAVPQGGDSLMVTLFGEPIVITRGEDEEIRAYRCLRRPRGAPQPVRCAIRYGMQPVRCAIPPRYGMPISAPSCT
ncbi:(2Fe-2S)-binding protein [Streptomyces fradiae]|uniref:(2Fe-2S)-binding protein n=1 Tax=Streptomyces fradiae TaxID=1906 RepID=UPI002942A23E|nr:(2Fe-2S)-binding protein [Streptomyces fradiae]WOI63323.1 (2Fe-2S)-binding protein [Streptomyces fradiae]